MRLWLPTRCSVLRPLSKSSYPTRVRGTIVYDISLVRSLYDIVEILQEILLLETEMMAGMSLLRTWALERMGVETSRLALA